MLKWLFLEHFYIIVLLFAFSEVNRSFLRFISLVTSVLVFNQCLLFLVLFNPLYTNYQFELGLHTLDFGLTPLLLTPKLRFGLDGLSVLFLVVTSFILPGAILYSVHYKVDTYYSLYLVLLFITNLTLYGFFAVLNFLFFYVCFEFILVPILILILVWGPRYKKSLAGAYMFLYTFFGSLLFFWLLVTLYLSFRTYDFEQIFVSSLLTVSNQQLYWCFCLFTFAVKVPIMPVHLWLPEAHVEAPTVGSVYLASLLLKLGGYGILRLVCQWLPGAMNTDIKIIGQLFIICSIVYCSILIFSQVDLKKIIAYSSIIHMNFALLGVFCFSPFGLTGCIYLFLGHSLVSGALFYLVGMLYDRTKSRFVHDYSSLFLCMPVWSFFFFIFSLSNAGFPGSFNFISELLLTVGIVSSSIAGNLFVPILAVIIGLFFGVWYSLLLVNRILFGGTFKGYVTFLLSDLTIQELLVLVPFATLTLFFGLSGSFVFTFISGFVTKTSLYYSLSLIPFIPVSQSLTQCYSGRNTGEIFLCSLPDQLLNLVTYFKHNSLLCFNQLIDITGADMSQLVEFQAFTRCLVLASINLFVSTITASRVYLLTWCTPDDIVSSLESTFINSGWYERENWDLFGIVYTTADLRRIVTNYGFAGFALRKSFPVVGYIEYYYNIALGYIMDQAVNQSQTLRLYSAADIWWPSSSVTSVTAALVPFFSTPYTLDVIAVVPSTTSDFLYLYIVLIIYVALFTLLPYLRNLLHCALTILLSFFLLVGILLYLGFEFISALILILYMGSILLVVLYVITILNKGILVDFVVFKGHNFNRFIFLLLSIKFIFFGQFLFSSLFVPSDWITTDYFQNLFTVVDDAAVFSQFFLVTSDVFFFTILISFILLLTTVILTLLSNNVSLSRFHIDSNNNTATKGFDNDGIK